MNEKNIERAIKIIERDILINQKSLLEDHHVAIKQFLRKWIEYDRELLKLLEK